MNPLGGIRLTPHKKDEDENVNDKHGRHDEGRSEPRGAKLRRHLQANSVTETEKQVTQPHEVEQPDRGIANRQPARSEMRDSQARTVMMMSPMAVWRANASGSPGPTTPGTSKVTPMNRNVCGTTRMASAVARGFVWSQGRTNQSPSAAYPRRLSVNWRARSCGASIIDLGA